MLFLENILIFNQIIIFIFIFNDGLFISKKYE